MSDNPEKVQHKLTPFIAMNR